MKFVCESCHTKYSIADEKVRRKILKIRCKTCSNVITVREPTGGIIDAAIPAPAVAGGKPSPPRAPPIPGRGPAEWHLAVAGEQHGPFDRVELVRRLAALVVGADVHIWREDFDGWKSPEDVPEVYKEVQAARSRAAARPPLPRPTAVPPIPRPVPGPPPIAAATKPQTASVEVPKPAGISKPAFALPKPGGLFPAKSSPPAAVLPVPGSRPAIAAASEAFVSKPAAAPSASAAAAEPEMEEVAPTPPPVLVPAPVLSAPIPPPTAAEHSNGVNGAGAAMAALSEPADDGDQLGQTPIASPLMGGGAGAVPTSPASSSNTALEALARKTQSMRFVVGGLVVLVLMLAIFIIYLASKPAEVRNVVIERPAQPAVPDELSTAEKLARAEAERRFESTVRVEEPAARNEGALRRAVGAGPGKAPPGPVKATEPKRFSPSPGPTAEEQALATRFSDRERRSGRPVLPQVGSGSVAAAPAVSQAAVTRVISNNKKTIESCYQQALRRDKSLTKGRIDVTVSIGVSGRVKRVDLQAPPDFKAVEPCIKDAVKRWVFPASPDEYGTTFPLLLHGSE